MCVYVCVCVCVCVYRHGPCVYISVYVCMCVCVCVRVWVWVCLLLRFERSFLSQRKSAKLTAKMHYGILHDLASRFRELDDTEIISRMQIAVRTYLRLR